MRNSKSGLLAAAALMAIASSAFASTPQRSTRRQSEEPRHRSEPYIKWQDTVNTQEIKDWNKAVEERRAARKARK